MASPESHPGAPAAGVQPGVLKEFGYASSEPGDIDPAEDFHEASKITAATATRLGGPAASYFISHPDAYRSVGVPRLLSVGERIPLRRPQATPVDLRTLAYGRRSRLPEASSDVPATALGELLGLALGARPDDARSRVIPSGGWLHPLDFFVLCNAVEGLAHAGYLYDSIDHCLRPVTGLDPVEFWRSTTITPEPSPPPVAVVIAATFARSRAKYGVRGYRFVLLEAGHAGQSLVTAASALGLASLPIGGFVDTAADRLLRLDGVNQSCLYQIRIAGSAGAS